MKLLGVGSEFCPRAGLGVLLGVLPILPPAGKPIRPLGYLSGKRRGTESPARGRWRGSSTTPAVWFPQRESNGAATARASSHAATHRRDTSRLRARSGARVPRSASITQLHRIGPHPETCDKDACSHACVTLRLVTVPGANFPAKNAEIGAIPGKLGYFRSVTFDRKLASSR